jgi:DNA polymerase I-like protein with 3'-5' exonuclease and polymerase domains
VSTRNYGVVRTAREFLTHARRLMQTPEIPVGFDIEAGYRGEDKDGVSLLPHHPDWLLVSFQFTNGRDWARMVPIAFDDTSKNVDDVVATARILWRLVNTCKIVPHNANYELTGVSRWFMETLADDPIVGEEVRAVDGFFPIFTDSYIEAKMLNQYDPLRVGAGLKGLSKHVLGQEMTEFRSLFPDEDTDMGPATKKSRLKYIRFNTRNPDSPRIIDYSCEDATAAWELSDKHLPALKDSEMWMMYQIEMRLLPILVDMEYEALVLDWPEIHRRAEEIKRFGELYNEEIQQEFAKRTGRATPVLLSSPKQLADVLFKDPAEGGLGLPVKKRSDKTQQPSTGNDALRVIAQKDAIIRDILTWRRVSKLYGSYLNKYDTQLNYAGNGRAYPNHNQIGAGTGRMSVDGVPYQQWPKPYHFELKDGTSFDLNFRDLLVSPEGFRIVGFDYSQIELRILAGQAGEDTMIQAFKDGVDIHRATAATMLRRPLEDIDKKQRGVGKTSNFAVVYQSGAENIADMLTAQGSPTTTEEAEQMLKDYFAAFPKLRAYMDKLVTDGSSQHYIMTPFGRKFTIWEYKDSRQWIRAKGDRLCVNAPIQGGAADYMKIGLVRAYNAIKKAEKEGRIPPKSIRLVMSVHDALEFYVHESVDTQTVIDLLDPMVAFDHPALGGVPIRADWHEGHRWGHVVEVQRDESGKITGYVNEDDDQVFENVEDAYARGLVLDEEKMAKYAQKIADRLAQQQGEQQAAAVQDSDDFADLPHPFIADSTELFCAICGQDEDSTNLHDLALAEDTQSLPGPSQPEPHPGPPSDPVPGQEEKPNTEEDLFAEIDALIGVADQVVHDPEPPMALAEEDSAFTALAKEQGELPGPTVLDAIDDAVVEAKAAEARERFLSGSTTGGLDHQQLKSEFYLRYHKEAEPFESPSAWLKRIGVSEDEARDDADAPEWAHTPMEPKTAQEVDQVWVLTVTEMPDEDLYEVMMSWLKKMDGYVLSRVILSTPEGDVELGEFAVGADNQHKVSRLVHGQFDMATRPKRVNA